MTVEELCAQWDARRRDPLTSSALVSISAVAELVLRELRELQANSNRIVSVGEAAKASGYSADHLRRALASGRLPNAGRKGKPAIRLEDLPRKPGHIALPSAASHISLRRRIVLDATTTPRRSE